MTDSPRLLASGEPSPGYAVGIAQPDVPWMISQHDLTRGVMIYGGQGCGKSSTLIPITRNEAEAPNTAVVVFDMKGSLAERLLREIPTNVPKRYYDHGAARWRDDQTKRLWHLDMADAAFGLTPLHVDPGWARDDLPDLFARIGSLIATSLTDLFTDQVFQSSVDIINRSAIAAMVLAWYEHDARHRAAGRDPEAFGFNGSFRVLVKMLQPRDPTAAWDRRGAPPSNPWHQAAGRACQLLPGMADMASRLLDEIPAEATDNLAGLSQRMAAPGNKLKPLVEQLASVRRFVEHPQRLSLASVLASNDILIVNPNTARLGPETPKILVNFMIHMIDGILNEHLQWRYDTRPRVTIVIDEAHAVITESLVDMISRHREAGLHIVLATQYPAQIGASLGTTQAVGKLRGGLAALVQTTAYGRMADIEEAAAAAMAAGPVFESQVRGEPAARARHPVSAATLARLPDFHMLWSVTSSGNAHQRAGGGYALTPYGGTVVLPTFTSRTLPMDEVDDIPTTYRDVHLQRMHDLFGPPTSQADLPVRIPAGLDGKHAHPVGAPDPFEAEAVAHETVGHEPERRPANATDASAAEYASVNQGDRSAPAPGHERDRDDEHGDEVGGTRVQRGAPAEEQTFMAPALFRFALRPYGGRVPDESVGPSDPIVQAAVARAAVIEQLSRLTPWETGGSDAAREIRKLVDTATEAAAVDARTAGYSEAQIAARAKAAGDRVRRAELAKHADERWRTPVRELALRDAPMQLLELLACFPYSHHELLRALMSDPPRHETLRDHLVVLRDAGLVAQTRVLRVGQGGKPIYLSGVTARGREALRHARGLADDSKDVPRHLLATRELPTIGPDGSDGKLVPHDLGVQITRAALSRFGATAVRATWTMPQMSHSAFDVRQLHPGDRTVHASDLVPGEQRELAIRGDRADAGGMIQPDLGVEYSGPVAGERRSLALLVEYDRTHSAAYNETKMVAYDHFLAGWCMRLHRFGPRQRNARPVVVFVCGSVRAARQMAARADVVMGVGVGFAGHDPATYQYYGRTHTVFTSLDWLLAGCACAFALPEHPPQVRGAHVAFDDDLRALLPQAWWPQSATSAARTHHRAAPPAP
jgi:hypothetical protein